MAWTECTGRAGWLARSPLLLGLFGLLGVVGCTAVAPRTSPLERFQTRTMMDVYDAHKRTGGAVAPKAAGPAGDSTTSSSTQTQTQTSMTREPRDRLPLRGPNDDEVLAQRRALSDPINNQFVRLPNPDLVMFVYPHLARGKYPVPGYVTVFPMYESIQYALPGEVAPREAPSRP